MDPQALPSRSSIPEIWPFQLAGDPGGMSGAHHAPRISLLGQNSGLQEVGNWDGSAEESTVTGQSGGGRNRRRRRGSGAPAAAAAPVAEEVEEEEDESSKLVSTSCGNDLTDSDIKRPKVLRSRDEYGESKHEIEANSGICSKPTDQSAQPSEAPKQDYIHVRARRGQATDSHSLAERARREKISERMNILQDLVPGCNKVIGKALVLDEIINYIQSLERQVEFLSMKLEAVNSRMNSNIEGFPAKDFGMQAFDSPSSLAFGSQPAREYGRGSPSEWLHMQVGGDFERPT